MSNFFVGCLENLRHQKDILKLTDLYDGRPMSDHVRWDYLKQFRQAKFDQV